MSTFFKSLPPQWRCEKLKHVADFRVSNVDKLSNELEEPVRLCNYTDVYHREFISPDLPLMEATATIAEIQKFLLKAGDVVITKDSESWDDIAVPALIEASAPDMVCGYHLAMIRGKERELDGRFLFRCFQSGKIRSQLEVEAKGVTRYGLPNSAIGETLLPLPPLPTQRRIAAYLDRETAQIDALVAEKEMLLGLLEEKRASLISHAVTRGLNPKAKLKPSGIPWLGDVPVHWDLVPLSSVISYLSYGFTNPMPSFHDGEGVPLLTANDIGEGVVKFETARKTTREAFSGLTGKCRPLKDDILITKDGTLGRIAVSDGIECCINQSVALLRINPAKANIRFVAIALAARAYQDRMIFEAGGTTIKHIYITRLAKMTFALPPKAEQNALVTYGMNSLAAIDSLLGSVNESITILREKRSSLISAAVTGEMAV